MVSEAFQLAILLSLKDQASGGLDRFEAKLRAAGKEGEHFVKDLDQIRSDLNRDIGIGGIGVAGLSLLGKGVKVAADYESVMTDLKATIAQTAKDGKTDFNQLAGEMMKAEGVAVELGNALPGTTGDFAEMMQVLKQNGLEYETIVNGAAKAVAHLAVANNALPKDIAADFAQYGNIFQLKPQDYEPAADVFSRIYTSTGQTSAELVEAAKYFEGRAGKSLGIGGLKDAEQMARIFGLFGMKGLRGSQAGTMLTDFFSEYNQNHDKLKDLEKSTGIKLDFFDKSGKFAGMDTVFEQMKQFDKLSDKDRSQWVEKIFGLRGMSAANVFLEEGSAGWKKFNDEQDKTVSQTDKVAMKTATFNNQMEALKGTLTNLGVAVFEPMLPGLTADIDAGNQLVGVIQQFTKNHPDIAKYAVEFVAIGSATMAAYSGIRTLTTGVQLYRLASRFTRGEGLLENMTQTSAATASVTRNVTALTAKEAALKQLGGTLTSTSGKAGELGSAVAATESKVGKLRGNLFSLNNVFKAVLVLEAIGFTWDQISELRKTVDEWHAMNKGLDQSGVSSYKTYQLQQQTTPEQRQVISETHPNLLSELTPDPKKQAREIFQSLEAGNKEFTMALDPSKQSWTDWYARGVGSLLGKDTNFSLYQGQPTMTQVMQNPDYYRRVQEVEKMPFKQGLVDHTFANSFDRVAAEIAAVKNIQQRAPALADPAVMAAFRKDVLPQMGLSQPKQDFVNQILQQAFPQSFAQSMTAMFQGAADSLTMSFSSLQQPIAGTGELFSGLQQPVGQVNELFNAMPQPVTETNKSLVELSTSANRLPPTFGSIANSANSVSLSLDGLSSKISSWQPPVPPSVPFSTVSPSASQPLFVPGHAVGGTVLRDGLIMAHAGNVITPARTTRGLSGFNDLMSWARSTKVPQQPSITNQFSLRSAARPATDGFELPRSFSLDPELLTELERAESKQKAESPQQPVTVVYSPKITINAASPAAKQEFEAMLYKHSRDLERILEKRTSNGRVRA